METTKQLVFEFSRDDVDKTLARNAHYNTSFSPDKRAEQEQGEYYNHLKTTYENLQQYAETEEQKTLLIKEMNRYKQGFLTRFNALLSAKSRCASSMITGGSNFPVERNKKRMKAADNKYIELKEFSEKALKSIKKKLLNSRNENQVQNDEFERLKNDVDRAIKWANDERYSFSGFDVTGITGKIKRSFDNGHYTAVKMILEYIQEQQKDLKKPYITKRHSVWKLLETETIEAVKENKKTGEELIQEFSEGKIVNNYDDERIRIYFNDKPSQEVITSLKQSAWKWSPYNKAWQRKNTRDAIWSAERIISKHYQDIEAA